MPYLPKAQPSLLFSIQAPRPWSGFLERPVLADGKVLLAGDDTSAVCLEGGTGRTVYHFTVPMEASDGYSGLPLPWDDGWALVPIYQKDASLKVYDISPAGAIGLLDTPGAEEEAKGNDMRIVAQDSGCKLFLMPLARGAGDDYLISWIYRQVRFYRTECRSFHAKLRWGSEEAMLATTPEVVLGVTAPVRGTDDRGTFIARDIRNGAVLWQLGARNKTHAATGEGVFYLLDRSARVAEDAARKVACDEEILEALAEEPALMGEALTEMQKSLLAQRPIHAPSWIMAIDAKTGKLLWEASLPGDVASVGGPSGSYLVALSIEGTRGALYRLDIATGAVLGSSSLGAGWPSSPFDPWSGRMSFELWSAEVPAVVGVDNELVAWASPEAIVAERLAEPFDKVWRWGLPAPCRAFRPRVLDRVLNEPAMTVGEGRIYLRDGWSLWAIGERASVRP